MFRYARNLYWDKILSYIIKFDEFELIHTNHSPRLLPNQMILHKIPRICFFPYSFDNPVVLLLSGWKYTAHMYLDFDAGICHKYLLVTQTETWTSSCVSQMVSCIDHTDTQCALLISVGKIGYVGMYQRIWLHMALYRTQHRWIQFISSLYHRQSSTSHSLFQIICHIHYLWF